MIRPFLLLALDVIQRGGHVGVEVDKRQADGGGQLIAVVVRQIIHSDGDLATVANEPSRTVDTERGTLG